MSDLEMVIVGNLTTDPELRFTANGTPVCNMVVAHTPRRYDSVTDQWVDGEGVFLRCTAWRDLAENIAASLTKGTRVVVKGSIEARSWETPEGDRRTALELQIDAAGADLRWARSVVHRKPRATTPAADVAPEPLPA